MQQGIWKFFGILFLPLLIQSKGFSQPVANVPNPPVANCPSCVPVANVIIAQGKREYWQGMGWYEQLPNGNWQKVVTPAVSEVTANARPFPLSSPVNNPGNMIPATIAPFVEHTKQLRQGTGQFPVPTGIRTVNIGGGIMTPQLAGYQCVGFV